MDDKLLKRVADFLFHHVPSEEGIMAEKRVAIFTGKGALQVMLSPVFQQKFKKISISNEKEAIKVLNQLLDEGFFIKSARSQARYFEPDVSRVWTTDGHYVWVYEGSQWKTIVGGIGLLIIALVFVMFPLWPSSLRVVVWYLGMAMVGFILFILGLGVVRLILFAITVIAIPPGIWLFPNLYEDVGFFESFVPVYEWCTPPRREKTE